MSKSVYVEARPRGRDGDPISHYVVEDQASSVLHSTNTQAEGIQWAKARGYVPHVARVRHLDDKRIPDHWRNV
ncbi:hypothetical protein K2X14_16150 [Acetobacter sp. TBRC 12305]|uniref:Uncharacterized protein n=1 Tax=Acetobacter garciniae TaxID=2817435 RepID=A0A939HQL4_9PROT|nr:hypothetical protein [Acetobacter garciniae]MBO1326328.1 hypothetical protein [Acetobacter garciniae]MBX0346365.1 hypothetical protein [Acetobacter garciniae]